MDSGKKNLDEVEESDIPFGKYVWKHFKINWILTDVVVSVSTPVFHSSSIDFGEEIGSGHLMVAPVIKKDFVLAHIMIDSVKSPFTLNYRFGFNSENGETWQNDFKCAVTKNTCLYEAILKCYDSKTMSLKVLCELIIIADASVSDKDMNCVENREEMDICLDFYNIFNSEYFSDITLSFGKKTINAHRAILASKSDLFREEIEKMKDPRGILTLPETDFKLVRSMLVFVYGGFEIWSKHYKPTIAFYDLISKYAVTDLRVLLSPTQINFEDQIFLSTSGFGWKINLYETFDGLFIKESPLFQTPFGSFKMKFSFDNTLDFVAIQLTPMTVLEPISLGLEIQIFDTLGKFIHMGRLNCLLKKGDETEHTISDFAKLRLITDGVDILRIVDGFAISGCFAFHNNEIVKRVSSLKKMAKTLETFANFKCLLDKNTYSDFHLNVGHFKFPVHKAILGGRCSYFKDLFEKYPKLLSTNAKDLKQSAVESFLVYLYSGNIGDDLDEKLDLLLVLNFYEVVSLHTKLRKLVSNAITLENAHTVLLKLYDSKCVEHFQDLKTVALTLLCSNFNVVELSQTWTDLSTQIARDVLLHLQEVYEESSYNVFKFDVYK